MATTADRMASPAKGNEIEEETETENELKKEKQKCHQEMLPDIVMPFTCCAVQRVKLDVKTLAED